MPRKEKRSITPLMVGHPLGDQGSFGHTEERFFTDGAEHEARGWDDVLPLDDEPEPRRRGGSSDRIPRRWSAVVALVALCICLLSAAAAGGYALFKNGRVVGLVATVRSWVSGTSRESVTVPTRNPVPPEAPRTNTAPAPTPSQVTPPQAPAPAAATSAAVAIPAEKTRPEIKMGKTEPAAPLPDIEGQERLRKDAIATRRRRHHSQSRDNYVWSTELNALVPISSMPPVEQRPVPPDPATGRPPPFERPH